MKKADEDIIDAKEADYLFVKESQLPHSGKGLVTAIDIYKDEVIAIFKGERLTLEQARLRVKKGCDQYFITLMDGSTFDSKNVNCFAKYANDANGLKLSRFRNNGKIAFDENQNVCIIATRKIKSGEEIFCGYGKKYWAKHG